MVIPYNGAVNRVITDALQSHLFHMPQLSTISSAIIIGMLSQIVTGMLLIFETAIRLGYFSTWGTVI